MESLELTYPVPLKGFINVIKLKDLKCKSETVCLKKYERVTLDNVKKKIHENLIELHREYNERKSDTQNKEEKKDEIFL